MTRMILTDAQWSRIEPHCLGKASDPGRTGGDARLFIEAVPLDCADRQPVARPAGGLRQLERGVQAVPLLGKGRRLQENFRRALRRPGPGVRHGRRHNRQGPPPRTGRKRGTQSQAIGKSRGGWTTKILALTDALGNLVRFELLPGQRYDTVGVAPLIEGVAFGGLIADKAFDADWIVAELTSEARR